MLQQQVKCLTDDLVLLQGCNFAIYDLLKVYFTPPDRPVSTVRKLACGATAGAISQTITYPLDVLRRKMQVTGMKDKVDFQYKNSFDAIRTIVQREGVRGLYTGLSGFKVAFVEER
jgi:solute carrier family 25 phosphate transporter 23/24/25/41